jgi:hydroxymethylbilane synthase
MVSPRLRIGTRRSPLALIQARFVADAITAATGLPADLVAISTSGDRDQRTPLTLLGGTGVFVTSLRDALVRREVDVAVHSYKDLPTAAVAGLAVVAVPWRADVRDALVSRDARPLAGLPPAARVGTGAPRRAAQLRALRPDLRITDVRGNLDTRLGKVAAGGLDAVILARAGLARLGRGELIAETFATARLMPAPGQGALAVEVCTDRADVLAAAISIDIADTHAGVRAERTLLAELEAGCSAPVGASSTVHNGVLTLRAGVFSIDGRTRIVGERSGSTEHAAAIGRALADDLLRRGAAHLLAEPLPARAPGS